MLFSRRPRRFLRANADPGVGTGGTGGSGGDAGGGTNGGEPARLPSQVEAEFQALMLRQAGADNATRAVATARSLYDDNHTLRKRLRTVKQELTAFQTRNPQGSVVLHGEELAAWNAYKALGKPDEVKAKIDAGDKVRGELAEQVRKTTRAEAAKLLAFNAAALDDRLTIATLDVEIREETASDGQKKRVPFARKTGDANAAWEPLATIATRDWTAHLPALKQAGGEGEGTGAGAGGVPFPNNGGGNGSGAPASMVDKFIKSTAEAAAARPNPLRAQGAGAGKP